MWCHGNQWSFSWLLTSSALNGVDRGRDDFRVTVDECDSRPPAPSACSLGRFISDMCKFEFIKMLLCVWDESLPSALAFCMTYIPLLDLAQWLVFIMKEAYKCTDDEHNQDHFGKAMTRVITTLLYFNAMASDSVVNFVMKLCFWFRGCYSVSDEVVNT